MQKRAEDGLEPSSLSGFKALMPLKESACAAHLRGLEMAERRSLERSKRA